ncbi:MAG: OmpH family outer membrane protein [bacterium]
MKRLVLGAVVSAALLPASLCFAEGQIGFVNATAVFEQYSAAKEAQQAYEKEMSDLNVQVEAMERDIKAAAETLEARKYLFSEERLREKQIDLEKKQQDYVKFRQEAETRAARRNEELTRPIVDSIEQAAKTVAEKDGFDLVLDAAAGIVVYSKPELDLTDRVLQELELKKQAAETGGGQ